MKPAPAALRRSADAARRVGCAAVVLWLVGGGTAAGAPSTGEFLYPTQPRDTLIGIARRLLLDPARWRDVQALNHIVDPRRLPPGGRLRIPYQWLRLKSQTATVVAVAGSVTEAGRKLAVGDLLNQGSVIETGADGSVTLDLADGSVVTVQKSSVLTLEEMERVTDVAGADSIRLKLDTGRVESKVKPHRDVGRFEIVTPVAVSAVRGTRFRNGYDAADPHATTETLDGSVGVGADAGSVAVDADFGTRVEPGRPPLPPVALLPAPTWSLLPESNSTPTLRVRLSAVPGARQYRLQAATDETFHELLADVATADGAVNLTDLPEGDVWLRGRAIDALGLEGRDAVRRIRQHVLPDAPIPAGPAMGAAVAAAPRIAWSIVTGSPRYRLQLAADEGFRSPLIDRNDIDGPAADLESLPPGSYFWRVAGVNAGGETGAWSAVQGFVVREPMPMPSVPVLAKRRLSFAWNPVAGVTYRVQISRDEDFERVIIHDRVAAPAWAAPRLAPGTYFIRLRGLEADGSEGPPGPARRFVVSIPLWVKIAAPLAIGLLVLL